MHFRRETYIYKGVWTLIFITMLSYRIVNVVCSAQLETDVTFQDFLEVADKRYTHRPTMAVFKRKGTTIILFTSKKIRIMGLPSNCTNTLEDLVDEHRKTILEWMNEFHYPLFLKCFTFNTSTMTHKIDAEINYFKNQHCLDYELEIFNAARFKQVTSCHVNVFASRYVVVTGVKHEEQMRRPIKQLHCLLNK